MKKYLSIIMILIIIVATLTCCQKNPMEVPQYPLNKETVEAALEKVDLPCVVSDATIDSDHRTSISLRDEEGRLIAGIASEAGEDWRFLGFTLIGYLMQGEASVYLPEEKWDDIIGLGTILYGGLTDQNQVYQDFIKNFEKESIIIELEDSDETSYIKEYEWIKDYGDIFCSIIVKETGDGIREISSFKFYNSPEISNTNSELRAKVVLNLLFTGISDRYKNYLDATEGKYSPDVIDTEFLESEYSDSYLKNYRQYYTETCLENMEKAGLFTLMDYYAYKENVNIYLTDVSLKEQKNVSQEEDYVKSYNYTVTLECKNDDGTKKVTAEGTIVMELMLNGWKVTDVTVAEDVSDAR